MDIRFINFRIHKVLLETVLVLKSIKYPKIMKNQNLVIYLLCLTISTLLLSACAEDGDPGPQGPQGVQGEQGEKGAQGEQGEPGTANVMYSDWMVFDWNLENFSSFKTHQLDIPEYSEEFVEKGGVILVYHKASPVGALPFVQQLPVHAEYSLTYTAYVPGYIRVRASLNSASAFAGIITNGEFRYILIPGGVNLNGRQSDYSSLSYREIKQMFHLPD